MEHLEKDGSIGMTANRLDLPNRQVELPPIERFQRALELAGVTPEYVAQKLAGMMEAMKIHIYNGKSKKMANDPIRLKAIEIWCKYFVEPERPQNHLHLHGAKIDELLGKTRDDQGKSAD